MQTEIVSGVSDAELSATAVAWPAVLAGAFVATAISLSLLILGSAFGFASFSPWHGGPSPVTFTALSAIWLIVMQWVSSAFGGYITGRMRTKWAAVHHTDEVFFRDTANGFITWAVSTVATGILAATVLASVIGGAIHAAGAMMPHMPPPAPMAAASGPGPDAYFIDMLFRSEHPAPVPAGPEANAEATRILLNGVRNNDVPQDDRNYLATVVSARTGIAPQEAQARVDDVIARMKAAQQKVMEAADTAHKAATTVSLFTFLSLLIGAFIACVGAALGGRERDLAKPAA